MKRLAVVLSVLLAATGEVARADQHPNQQKGFAADGVYQFGNIDHVNLFNGALNLTIPMGQSFVVSDSLSYRLVLTYSGNDWDYDTRESLTCLPDCRRNVYNRSFPNKKSNAGMGWFLSFGQLVPTDINTSNTTSYRGPDGAEHELRSTMHPGETPEPNVTYTTDGSYLRSKVLDATTTLVEFPDGTSKRFRSSDGLFLDERDSSGNMVTLQPSLTVSGIPIWTITDGAAGRVIVVNFARLTNADPDQANYDVVKTVVFPTVGAGTATYTFHYNPDANGSDRLTTVSRPFVLNFDPAMPKNANVPILTSVDLPDGTSFGMKKSDGTPDYDMGDGVNLAAPGGSVNLTGLTLPTLGRIEWDNQRYDFPSDSVSPAGGGSNPRVKSIGVKERRMKAKSGTVVSKTQYETRLVDLTPGSPRTLVTTVKTLIPATNPANDVLFSKTMHYFSVGGSSPEGQPCPVNDVGNRLTLVTMTGSGVTQNRQFTYDGRGFLTAEQHPELGVLGYGVTTYSGYDARGHVSRKVTGAVEGSFDLKYMYDKAERLVNIDEIDPSSTSSPKSRRPEKQFTFATDYAPPDYRLGKLRTATRYNYLDNPYGAISVTETYAYAGRDGAVSSKTTDVAKVGTTPQIKSFSQGFTYDELGAPVTLTYPSCSTGCGGTLLSAVTDNYSRGFLTGVAGFGTLTYSPNGTVNRVVHGGVTDTYAPDPTA